MYLGKKIQKIRELLDISREQMADKLHMSLRTYGKIETGETKEEDISIGTLNEIAATLIVSPEFIKNFDPMIICNNTIHNDKGNAVLYNNGLITGADAEVLAKFTTETISLQEKIDKKKYF